MMTYPYHLFSKDLKNALPNILVYLRAARAERGTGGGAGEETVYGVFHGVGVCKLM